MGTSRRDLLRHHLRQQQGHRQHGQQRRGPTPQVGFNDDYADLEAQGFGTSAGAKYARFPINPNELDNAQAAYDKALAAGVKPIISTAGWGNGPKTSEEYATQMADMARRFPRAVFQLWNEPNFPYFNAADSAHPQGLTAAEAAQFATAGAQAIKGVNPQARVIGPSISPMAGWKQYFNELYSSVPKGLMETSLNLYPAGKHRVRKVKRAVQMASQYGAPVDITELDVSAPWMGKGPGPRATKRAIRAAAGAGADMVLLNDLQNHEARFAAIRAALQRRRQQRR